MQGRKRKGRIRAGDGFAESLAAFIRPDDAAHAVECEMAESFFDEIFGAHLSGQAVRSGDVGYGREAFLEILRHGDDAVLEEQFHVVRVVELPDHGVGLHAFGPLDDRFDAEFVADRKRQFAQVPGLSGLFGVAGYSQQDAAGVFFGEVRQENYACHFSSGFS